MQKISSFYWLINFRVQLPDWPYQHAKNETVSSICSGETVHLEILQSDWLRGLYLKNEIFPKGFKPEHSK